MPKRTRLIIASFIILFLFPATQCSFSRDFLRHVERDVGYGGYRASAAGELPAKCRMEKKVRQWYFLYGSFNLFGDEIVNTLQRKDRVFRLRTYATFWDKFISIGLGFVTSLSVRTIEIQTCESRGGKLATREKKLNEMQAEIAKQKEALEERKRLLDEKEKQLKERENRPGNPDTRPPS